jgi:hypothetical protein
MTKKYLGPGLTHEHCKVSVREKRSGGFIAAMVTDVSTLKLTEREASRTLVLSRVEVGERMQHWPTEDEDC